MVSTPSTRCQLDGVAVWVSRLWVSRRSIRSERPRLAEKARSDELSDPTHCLMPHRYIWADADGNGLLDRNEFAEMIRSIDALEGPSIRKARSRASLVCAWPRITGNTTQAHDARLQEMANGDAEPPRHPWDALGKQEDGTVYKRVLRAVVKRLMRRHDLHEGDVVSKMEWDAAVNAVTFSG